MSPPVPFRPGRPAVDRSRPVAPQVFDRLREEIIALDLAPGTVLSRVDLAERFGVSSTPVRDALQKLGEEGLVDIFPQHATRVSRIDGALAHHAHVLRRSIELEVVAILVGQSERPFVATLGAMLSRQRRLLAAGDLDELSLADSGFHQALYDAAGVPDLWPLVRRESGHLDRLRNLHLPLAGKAESILAEHAGILAAIGRGDLSGAQAAMRAHLSGTLANVEALRDAHPDYFRSDDPRAARRIAAE